MTSRIDRAIARVAGAMNTPSAYVDRTLALIIVVLLVGIIVSLRSLRGEMASHGRRLDGIEHRLHGAQP